MTIRVNIKTRVNSADIRQETRNGRDVIIVPGATMPDNVVMNRIFYPAAAIEASYKTLERTPAPAGHPEINGNLLSARDPEAINGWWVGAWNENVRRDNGRVKLDKVIDVEAAQATEKGRAVLAAINERRPIHTSTGIYMEVDRAESEDYDWIAREMVFDHDAILVDEEGAATPEQGVGMMVNGKQIDVVNSMLTNQDDALPGSAEDFRNKLETAIRERFGDAWVHDYNDTDVVFWTESADQPQMLGYTASDDGAVTLADGEPTAVESTRKWTVIGNMFRKLLRLSSGTEQNPGAEGPNANHHEGDTMPLTDEQREELRAIASEQVQANASAVTEAVETAVKPLREKIETLEANAKAQDEAQRAEHVTAIVNAGLLDEETAKTLETNALATLASKAQPGTAAPIMPHFAGNDTGDDKHWSEYDPYAAAREA